MTKFRIYIFLILLVAYSVQSQEHRNGCDYSGDYIQWSNCIDTKFSNVCRDNGNVQRSDCIGDKLAEATEFLRVELRFHRERFDYSEELENAVGLYNVFIKGFCRIENTLAFVKKQNKLNVLHIYECRSRLKLHLAQELRNFRRIAKDGTFYMKGCSLTKNVEEYVSCLQQGFGARNMAVCNQKRKHQEPKFNLDECNKSYNENKVKRERFEGYVNDRMTDLMNQLVEKVGSDTIRENIKLSLRETEVYWNKFTSELCLYQFWSSKNVDLKECRLALDFSRTIYLEKLFNF